MALTGPSRRQADGIARFRRQGPPPADARGENMGKQDNTVSIGVSRRGLLRAAGLGAGVAGLTATGLGAGTAQAAESADGARAAGYRESDHVKAYYQALARY